MMTFNKKDSTEIRKIIKDSKEFLESFNYVFMCIYRFTHSHYGGIMKGRFQARGGIMKVDVEMDWGGGEGCMMKEKANMKEGAL